MSMAASRSGRAFVSTDRPDEVTAHARERWAQRGDPSMAIEVAWREAEPVPVGVHNAKYARFHEGSGTVIIGIRTMQTRAVLVLRTAIPAADAFDAERKARRDTTRLAREMAGGQR